MIDGYASFCSDSRNFFIDWTDLDGNLSRAQINSDCANKLRYVDQSGEYMEIDLVSYIDGSKVRSMDSFRQEFLGGEW